MYSPWPRMNRGSSLRLTEWPMPPTSGVVWVAISAISFALAQLAAAGSAGASVGAAEAARSSAAACWIALTMFT